MSSSVVIDECGFAAAMSGFRPKGPSLFEDYVHHLLPLSEYRSYLTAVFSARPFSVAGRGLFDIFRESTSGSQPDGLTLAAASHSSLPDLLYGIPVSIMMPTLTELLDSVRIATRWPGLSGAESQLVAAAHVAKQDVLVCGATSGEALKVFETLKVSVEILEHDCARSRRRDGHQ